MLNRFSDRHAGFDDPVSLLLACHERVRHYLGLLQKLSAHLPVNGSDAQARDAAKAILRYFDVAAPLHHQDEDDDLFPLLQQRGDPQLQTTILTLQNEHPHLHAQWAATRSLLLAIAAGEAVLLDQARVDAFAQQYVTHAGREENEVYPQAAHLLSEAEREAMGRNMAARRSVAPVVIR